MSEEIKDILEEIRFKAGIYRDQKRRNEAFNDNDYKCYVLLNYLQQKENIIKEVREYIKENDNKEPWKSLNGKELLEILDKESK